MKLRNLVSGYKCFGETWCIQIHVYSEDGGSSFLRDAGNNQQDGTGS
jgi:hypothetical protein